ncbi:MAG: ABC transporter substrate-binding protein [Thermoleophilia bacterium]|nr:ABC transporter substrate-binding protein [Thermoleophilia bacterium]
MAACGDDDSTSTTGGGGGTLDGLTIGALIPQTGDLSIFAPAGEKAAKLAVEQANAALESAGSSAEVTLTVGDTETKPQATVQAANKLISADGASCFAGAWASADTIPAGQSVAAKQQIPLISPASTSPEITDLPDDGYVFRTAPSDALQGQVLADAVGETFGTDATISVAARNDAYGEGIATQFSDAYTANGGSVNGPVLYDPEASSYDSEAAEIVADKPDGYVIIDFEDPYGKVGAALVRTGDFDATKMYTADGLAFDKIPDTIPSDALDGANGTRPATPEGADVSTAFNTLYEESSLSPKERNTFDAQNFDAVSLCVLAAVAAGSSDGADIQAQVQNVASAPGDKYDYTNMADAITALQNGDDIDFDGVSGPLDLDDQGDPTVATYEVFNYKGGKLVVDRQVEKKSG